MRVEGLEQPPFNTTLMGVVTGAMQFYGTDISQPAAFGGSGHAFLINLHGQLCPSGPYCWDMSTFLRLVRNIGLEVTDLGFFHAGSSAAERSELEERLRAGMKRGVVSSLVNTENQLILGYDDQRFLTARPWPNCTDFPPGTLTFGTWAELGDEMHANFFQWRRCEPSDALARLREALTHAVSLFQEPRRHAFAGYGVGPDAYDLWLGALPEHGASHGNWWNATVWAECRQMASRFLAESAAALSGEAADRASRLAARYADVADGLARAADRDLPVAEKALLVGQLKVDELAAVADIEELLRVLPAGGSSAEPAS